MYEEFEIGISYLPVAEDYFIESFTECRPCIPYPEVDGYPYQG